ncbi:MAG TPA: efflux RND transporter permease subunit [Thermosynechococcaceae cyanobacterium]
MTTPPHNFQERLNLSRLAIQFPWITLGFWIAVSVAGLLAFSSLKYALFPDITFPVVLVNATVPLTNALDTEAQLTTPLEKGLEALNSQGLKGLGSTTYPGRSIVNLSFAVGTNLEKSSQLVETTLKQLTLPQGASYEVRPVNLNESAVISYALDSPNQTLVQLTQVAQEQILPTIAQVPGVRKVTLVGTPAEAKVAKLPSKVQGVEEVVLAPGSSAVRFAQQDVLAVEVVKRGDANTLEVVRKVDEAVQRLQNTPSQSNPASNPVANVRLRQASTQADYINEATHATIDALGLAIVLSVVVIFPFLWDWKATVISALAIPTSLLGTAIVMALLGLNLETITLLALALVIGIIVDDAIVDVENISRHLEAGEPPKQAAIAATDEIGLTVSAATLTIAAVFLPVAFMGGVIGQFFKPFGITVSASVLISLLVARTLSPMLAAYWLRSRGRKESLEEQSHHRLYTPLLAWALRHRWIVLAIALLTFAVGMALIPIVPKGFIPKLDRGEFNLTYTAPQPKLPSLAALPPGIDPANLPPGIDPAQLAAAQAVNPLTASLDAAKQLEIAVLKHPQVASVFTTVGTRPGQPNRGTLYVRLKPDRTLHTAEVQDQLRQQLPSIAGVSTSVEDIQFIDTGGEKPLQVAFYGSDLAGLDRTAQLVKQRVEKLPGFSDVTTTTEANKGGILEIRRKNGKRVAFVSANLGQGLALGDATDQVVAIAKEVKPADVSLDLGGDSARVGEVFSSFGGTLSLSALCVVAVLVLLFRNWLDPLVIALSLPLSIVGAVVASLLTRRDFGIISVIGIIFLLGLTNKNAILLVDYTNQLRRAGNDRTSALLKAGSVRLRPILMTTAATILGMMPIALGLGAGAELRAPMAIAIIGGLITSTLLSLLVVPAIYALLDDLRQRLRGDKHRAKAG